MTGLADRIRELAAENGHLRAVNCQLRHEAARLKSSVGFFARIAGLFKKKERKT